MDQFTFLAFANPIDAFHWRDAFTLLLKTKFDLDVVQRKAQIVQSFVPIWLTQLNETLACSFQENLEIMERLGVADGSERKRNQSHLRLFCPNKTIIPLYGVLYNTMLYLFLPNNKTGSVNTPDGQLMIEGLFDSTWSVIYLRHIFDAQSTKTDLVVSTPLKKYHFECPNEEIASQWVNDLSPLLTGLSRGGLTSSTRIDQMDTRGYSYSGKKRITKGMVLKELKSGSTTVKKKHNLKETTTIGRSSSADVQIRDPYCSRLHCRIIVAHGIPVLINLGSTGRLFLNQVDVTEPQPLKPGDIISVGNISFRFSVKKGVHFHSDPLVL